LLALFGVVESRIAAAPLVPFKELTKPLRVANGIVVLFSAALFPMWFVSSLYLQQVLGLSPLHAGLIFLPMALTIMVVASRAGKLVSLFGVRAVLGSGLVMMTAGMLLFTRVASSGSPLVYVMVPGLLTAAGIAMSIVPSTIAATQGAKEGQAGLASGLVNTSRQVGGGLGLALLITLATQYTTHLIGHGKAVPESLTQGFRLAYVIGAGFCALAALITFVGVQRHAGQARHRLRLPATIAAVLVAFGVVEIATAGNHGAPIGAYTKHGAYEFVTEPGLHPPKVTTGSQIAFNRLAPGYIFITNFYDITQPPMVGQSGPLILDSRGQPVWFRSVSPDDVAGNLALQSYDGKPALSWWQGDITNTGQTLRGVDVVVDQHYRPIARLRGQDGWILTLHEMIIRGHHAWVTANKNLAMDLSKYGGAYNGALIDSAVQEYDLRTGKLLYTWDALKHVSLSDSVATLPTNGFPWDAYHVNSIQLLPNGKFVASMRNTWAAYLVDRKSGNIEWTLGGRHSSFKFGKGADFQWQHDVQVYPNGAVSMFDDHCCQITGGGTYVSPTADSRALILKLDQQHRLATLVTQYARGRSFDADYMGSTQPLPNGNVLVGWGSQPYLTEFSQSGDLLLDAKLPKPDISYRATVDPWVGLPLYPPRGAAVRQGGAATVYASWNGATQLASWRVLGISGTAAPKAIAAAAKSGFETRISVTASGFKAFQLQALDAQGKVLGTSQQFG
jgi:hypothetical protein